MKNGFTLVELSIVLVILGLLVGGILAGQSMIRASEIRRISSEISTISTSMNAFRGKYLALPGDMPNATQFWDIQAGTTGNDDTCYLSESNSPRTCNGNGDGYIFGGHTNTGHHERARAWQHMANAGMISGSYTGVHGIYTAESRVGGRNAYLSSIDGTHYNLAYHSAGAADPEFYPMQETHMIEHTVDFPVGTSPPRNVLWAEEAWNIDVKMDDGKPAIGSVRGPKMGGGWAPNCTTATDATAEYALNSAGKNCYILAILR